MCMYQCQRLGAFYLLTIIVGSILSAFVGDVGLAFVIAPGVVLLIVTPIGSAIADAVDAYRRRKRRERNFPRARVRKR